MLKAALITLLLGAATQAYDDDFVFEAEHHEWAYDEDGACGREGDWMIYNHMCYSTTPEPIEFMYGVQWCAEQNGRPIPFDEELFSTMQYMFENYDDDHSGMRNESSGNHTGNHTHMEMPPIWTGLIDLYESRQWVYYKNLMPMNNWGPLPEFNETTGLATDDHLHGEYRNGMYRNGSDHDNGTDHRHCVIQEMHHDNETGSWEMHWIAEDCNALHMMMCMKKECPRHVPRPHGHERKARKARRNTFFRK